MEQRAGLRPETTDQITLQPTLYETLRSQHEAVRWRHGRVLTRALLDGAEATDAFLGVWGDRAVSDPLSDLIYGAVYCPGQPWAPWCALRHDSRALHSGCLHADADPTRREKYVD